MNAARVRQARERATATFGRNYDARRLVFGPPQQRLAQAAEPAVQRRRFVAESGVAELSAAIGDEVRVTWNESGLPRTLRPVQGVLSSPSDKGPRAAALDFLRSQPALFPLSGAAIESLQAVRESPIGLGTQITFQQGILGVPVFRGLIQVTVDASGQVLAVASGDVLLSTAVDTSPSLTPQQAIGAALRRLGKPVTEALVPLPASPAGLLRFRNPVKPAWSPVLVEPAVFPLSPESGQLAYRIYLQLERGRHYELLIDAASGKLLFSQNLVHSAGKARVWKESPVQGPREMVDLPDSWLSPGTTRTTGNNVDAYLDTDSDDEPDPGTTAELSDGRAYSATQFFVFMAGEGSMGQDPAQFGPASVTNLFYSVNIAHDYFYDLGFDEIAGNFQTLNFSRGGLGNDHVLAEAQDYWASLEGGNFVTLPDGESPRMEVGVDPGADPTAPTDDRDGSYSGQLVIHEYAHGVTDRLVGGPNEVTCMFASVQSVALSEGTSDYFAVSYFNNPVLDAYMSRNPDSGYRRRSYENYPLTYEHFGNEGFEGHNDGELWAAALWDLRKQLGQQVTDRLVMNSFKTLPCTPNLIDARDAILSADGLTNGGANRRKIWESFARHGFGHSARAFGKLAGADPLVFDAAWDLPPDYVTTNRGPKVISQPPEYAMYGEKLTYSIKASDPDGDKLTYELVDGPSGMTVDANTGLLQWMPTLTARRAVIRITDGKDGKVTHGILVPVFTPLEANRPIGIEGPRNSFGVAVMNVPAKTTILQFTLRGGNGDPDMMVVDPLFDIYGMSLESGTTETISVAAPEAGFWGVIVEASGAYQNVTLKGALLGAEVLTPGIPKSGLSGDRTSETFYKVVVSEGASRLRVTTSGGTGDLDLMARFGKAPVCSGILAPCDFDEASWENGNQESVDIGDVLPGEWFINLSGYEAYQDATLLVTLIGPDFSAEGVTNGASFLPPVSPGGIFTVFGKKLAREETKAGSVPLPTTLGDTSVTVNGTPAPLFYVSPAQINAQIPLETKPGEASVVVKSGDMLSDTVKISVLASAPGIFLYGGDKPIVVNHEDGSLNDAAHPVKAGKYIIAYLTGVSPLDNPLQTGAAVPHPPLFQCTAPFSATLGGKPAEVGFLGLTPNYVGLGQANIKTPADLAPGNYALRITIGGVESNGPIIAVAAP